MPHVKRKYSECLNCGARLAASPSFCPECGQANHDLNIPVRHLFEEFIEGLFHFDAKSFRTILSLAFKPGFISTEFVRGKRVQYVAPVRLYVFISFLFFLLLSLPHGKQEQPDSTSSISVAQTITFYNISSQELRGMQHAQLDSVLQVRGVSPSVLNKYVVRQMARIATDGQEGFNHFLVKGISYMMFALMPLFALIVYLLHRKKAQYYIGTLIFSIHYHSFIFLLFSVSLIVNRLAGTSYTFELPIIICPMYLFLALRHVYKDSRIRTVMKIILIGVLQLFSLAVVFLITVFVSILIF
jgi:hypothetical protein